MTAKPLFACLLALGAAAPLLAATADDLAPKAGAAPVSCVSISRIRETRVRDDRTIDFVMSGGHTLRNTLPNSCAQLGSEKAFSYATSLSQLCSTDIITVLYQGGGGPSRGASCGLGEFQEMTPAAH
jgi:hypothetical protein